MIRTSRTEVDRLLQEGGRAMGVPRGYAREFSRMCLWSECVFPGAVDECFLQPNRLFTDPRPNVVCRDQPDRVLRIQNAGDFFWLEHGPGVLDWAKAELENHSSCVVVTQGGSCIIPLWYLLDRTSANGITIQVELRNLPRSTARWMEVQQSDQQAVFVNVNHPHGDFSTISRHLDEVPQGELSLIAVRMSRAQKLGLWIECSVPTSDGHKFRQFDAAAARSRIAASITQGMHMPAERFHGIREKAAEFLVPSSEESVNHAG